VAAYRFIVKPSVVQDVLSRGLVFRHELVHVALGMSDDRSPVWLAEGAAEYVARSTWPIHQRRFVAAQQLRGVRPVALEATSGFYQGDPGRNYALAALVCDYVATTRGAPVLWALVGDFSGASGSAQGGSEEVVRRRLGLSTRELSAQALAWARAS
jgi:hypothetical protein